MRERAQALLAAREESSAARDQLAFVTQPGVEVCPLRPRAAVEGDPYGVLYVAPDHQHWYLALRGLEPQPEGQAYQLWFVVEDGAVSAGTFTVEGDQVELGSESMPEGTRGVMVTLEDASGSERPSGPEVLFGDEVMRLS